jgi:hypothetical protein
MLSNYPKRHKILVITASIIVAIAGVVFWLHYPLVQSAGSSNGYACSRDHIYIPRRLDFKGCRTVTGVIKVVKFEPDGDIHASLQLDPQYRWMLTKQNYTKVRGYLVVEDTCHGEPKAPIAKVVCRHYRSTLPTPELNHRYELTGNYVVDDWHGSWAEIHGLSEQKRLD